MNSLMSMRTMCARRRTGTRRAPWPAPSCRRRWGRGRGTSRCGRFGSCSPARAPRPPARRGDGVVLADHALVQLVLHAQQLLRSASSSLRTGCPSSGDDLRDLVSVTSSSEHRPRPAVELSVAASSLPRARGSCRSAARPALEVAGALASLGCRSQLLRAPSAPERISVLLGCQRAVMASAPPRARQSPSMAQAIAAGARPSPSSAPRSISS